MGRLTPVFGVLGLFGFAVLHACASDDAPGADKPSGGGGDGGGAGAPSNGGSAGSAGTGKGGGAATGGSSKGGSSGSAGSSGAAGQAGEPGGGMGGDSGSAGEGGMGAVGPGTDCTTCVDGGAQTSPRAVLLDQCADSPPCTAWMTCMRGCSDAACLDACEAAHPGVSPYRYAIYTALCDACEMQCSVLDFCDRPCVDDLALGVMTTAPETLYETGLYNSPTATPNQVANYVRAFQPEYELWSDGAQKRRWAYIPACSRIGTEGINHWMFPVGTRMWKEFVVPTGSTTDPVRVETRMLHKFGAQDTDWLFASYQWPMTNASPTAADATLASVGGVPNANGTLHDIPAVAQCRQCHEGLAERVLGFSAYQLSHNLGGVNIQQLADAGWLTHNAAASALGGALARNGYDPPGSQADQRALGYLHANCGNCHNFNTMVPPASPVRMRLMVGANTLQTTDTYTSLVNVATFHGAFVNCDRIEPGDASRSEILMRMGRRPTLQMPPLGTEQVHTAAITELTAWINAMPASGTPSTCVPPP